MMKNEIGSRIWFYDPQERVRRTSVLMKINHVAGGEYAMSTQAAQVNAIFAAGKMTFEERASIYNTMYGLSLEQQVILEDAQRQSYASVILEGYDLDDVVLLLSERALMGEITMDQKLVLIKRFYV